MHITHINLAKGFRGGERQTVLLIEELAKNKIYQTLVCREDSPMRDILKNINNLDFYSSNNFFSGHFGFNKKTDILHAHEAKAARWAQIENIFKNRKYIITRRVLNNIKQNFISKKLYQNASAVVAISSAIKNILLDFDKNIKIELISSVATTNNVNLDNVFNIKSRFKNKKLIGHIGALVDLQKGQSYIIEAAKELEKVRDDLAFVFVGTGKDENILKDLAKNLQNVYFEGFKTNVVDYISAFDLFIFPSLEEGLGSTLIDVMRLEVPIIATNVGGIPDLIENQKTGILIAPKNANAIKEAILKMIDEDNSELIKNAKDKAKEFTPGNMAKSYINLYNKLIK